VTGFVRPYSGPCSEVVVGVDPAARSGGVAILAGPVPRALANVSDHVIAVLGWRDTRAFRDGGLFPALVAAKHTAEIVREYLAAESARRNAVGGYGPLPPVRVLLESPWIARGKGAGAAAGVIGPAAVLGAFAGAFVGHPHRVVAPSEWRSAWSIPTNDRDTAKRVAANLAGAVFDRLGYEASTDECEALLLALSPIQDFPESGRLKETIERRVR